MDNPVEETVTDETAAPAEQPAQPEQPTAQEPVSPQDVRLYTVEQWARGRPDPITVAFVSEHKRGDTMKRSAAEWMLLFKAFLSQPRG